MGFFLGGMKEKRSKGQRPARDAGTRTVPDAELELEITNAKLARNGDKPKTVDPEPESTSRELYFAYGSCMSEDFARSVPQFTCLGRAMLHDYALAFTRYSYTRGGGVADIVSSEGSVVEGVLYELSSELLPDLDVREGVRSGAYQRIRVTVQTPFGRRQAWTYEVIEKEEEELPPTAEYAHLILTGARSIVSPAYFQRLKGHIASLQDNQLDH